MVVGIAADHRGYNLKNKLIQYLKSHEYDVRDFGTDSEKSTDYPDFAEALARKLKNESLDYGILICKTGIGMSISANKIPGVYAALVMDNEMAESAKRHNNANVLVFPASKVTPEEAWNMFEIWIKSSFEGGRHERRLKKIRSIENEQ